MKTGDTYFFKNPVYIASYACCGGRKEAEGPLADGFDLISDDNRFGQETWEKSESKMVESACHTAFQKAGISQTEIGCALGGDLLNQCISTGFAARQLGVKYFGLYGACSTMAEGLILGSTLVSGGFEPNLIACASSHFCTAERQYRYPLEYGSQRSPTAQWTATASGAVVLTNQKQKLKITSACAGRVYDPGVTDINNMGAAMAQSAYETLSKYFKDTQTTSNDYDLIVTGDLSSVGFAVVKELFLQEGIDISRNYNDCGLLLFDKKQDVHAGGSGCGCSAAVLCAYILPKMERGELNRVLFCGTGAMMSPTSANQGESIPGICHLVCVEVEK